jgi:hypothetical protein
MIKIGRKTMSDKITVIALVLLSVIFVDSNAMTECSKQCENAQHYKTCLITCLLGLNEKKDQVLTSDSTIKISIENQQMSKEEAKTEWFKRYPCTPFEETDCYYPYRGNYKKGIKRDNKKRASYPDDDY